MKFKYDIEKNQKLLKKMEPDRLDSFLFWTSLVLGSLVYDLQLIFNVSLGTFLGVLGTIFTMETMYLICWLIHSIIHGCIVHHRLKNTKLDKEVTNEDK